MKTNKSSPKVHLGVKVATPEAGAESARARSEKASLRVQSPVSNVDVKRLQQMPAWPESGSGCMMLGPEESGTAVVYVIRDSKVLSAFTVISALQEASYLIC